ncbi:hypothetical protein ABT282_08820 [Streptomyces sp. NPDC000927]|uniref:hypothetical protein n=1 Tax=Streptomyces sp. NPDC000927 TaxID=3154371 RepID=UPI003331B803
MQLENPMTPKEAAKSIADIMNKAGVGGVEFDPSGGELVVLAWKDGQLHTVCRIVEGGEDVAVGNWHIEAPRG